MDQKDAAEPGVGRREFMKIACASLAGASVGVDAWAEQASPQKPQRPNILVFLTDDHGQWAQAAYGNTELRTPNLDRLAREGVRMTRAFTPSPVCSPARACFFTGLTPSQHGIHDWLLEPAEGEPHPGLTGQVTIAQLLKKAGYHLDFCTTRRD